MNHTIPAGPVIKTDAGPIHLLSIIPVFCGQGEYLANLIRERYHRTGITDYALACLLHPQGEDPWHKVECQAVLFRELKKRLADTPGIRLGVLIQSIIGHSVSNGTGHCSLKSVHMRNFDGKEDIRCCPNDPVFLKYTSFVIKRIIQEKPAFCMTDDDMRLTSAYCTCRLHLADISRRSGVKVTRTRLKKALKAAAAAPEELKNALPRLRKTETPDEDDRIAAAYNESKIASIDQLSRVIRQAIDEVDPGMTCSSCVCYDPDYTVSRMDILTGDAGSPMLRISNGLYLELAVKDLAWRMGWTGIQRAMYGKKGWLLLDETDTYPRNRYSKTAKTLHLHLAAALADGLDGGKLFLDQSVHPLHRVSLPYEKILAEHQGFYRELRQLAKNWKQLGFVNRILPVERGGTPDVNDWLCKCFNHMGIPCYYGDMQSEGITSLAGTQVDHFNDEEITQILSGKVLIDGEAALHLTQRGYAPLMGVEAVRKNYAASIEECLLTGICDNYAADKNAVFFQALPGSEVLGKIKFRQYSGGPDKDVMPGTVYFRNHLGGEIITSSMLMRHWHFKDVLLPGRKLMYLAWLEKLGGIPCWMPEDVSAKLFAGQLAEKEMAIALFNFSYDPLDVVLCVKQSVQNVLELQPEGDWKPVDFTYCKGTLTIQRTLETAGIGIYRLFTA